MLKVISKNKLPEGWQPVLFSTSSRILYEKLPGKKISVDILPSATKNIRGKKIFRVRYEIEDAISQAKIAIGDKEANHIALKIMHELNANEVI